MFINNSLYKAVLTDRPQSTRPTRAMASIKLKRYEHQQQQLSNDHFGQLNNRYNMEWFFSVCYFYFFKFLYS